MPHNQIEVTEKQMQSEGRRKLKGNKDKLFMRLSKTKYFTSQQSCRVAKFIINKFVKLSR